MNHDYAHCTGEQYHNGTIEVCPLRSNCQRYILHLDALAEELEYVCYFMHDKSIAEGCTDYWPGGTSNNDYDATNGLNKSK